MDLRSLIIIVSLLFPVIAVCSFILYRKKKRPGKEILAARADAQIKKICVTKNFTTTTTKKWCRIRATFTCTKYSNKYDPRLHPYTLIVSDEQDTVLFNEEKSLTEFFNFCWYPGTKKKAQNGSTCCCDAVVLEFIPPWPGIYRLRFELKALETASEITGLTMQINEDVWPLKQKPYTHTCIDLRYYKPLSGVEP